MKTINAKLKAFFNLIEVLYTNPKLESLNQGIIDELIWAYLMENSDNILLIKSWHGDLNDIDEDYTFLSSPIRRFCDELNRNDINAELAKKLWFEIMDKEGSYTQLEMELKAVYDDEVAFEKKEYLEITSHD